MSILRVVALVAFAAGVSLLALGVYSREAGDSRPTAPFVPLAATATPTPTPAAAAGPSPTPTPTPYNGNLARMRIPRFGVDAPVEVIGLKPGNELDTPHDPHDVGWYDLYSKPGFGGNALFSGHVDYWPDILGPFHKLSQLALDDEVAIVRDNGTVYRYHVVSRTRYPADAVPMGELIAPASRPPDREWITLITCGGDFKPVSPEGWGVYLSRDVVVAERVE